MITLWALLLNMAGATLFYLASARQKLLSAPLRVGFRMAGLAAIGGGAAAWLAAAGLGAGIATTLTSCMLTWVALPYLAWWRSAPERVRAGNR